MSTLSLDLRGLASSQGLTSENSARGAGVSVLAHCLGIAALLLIPLLGATSPPKPAGPSHEILFQPIRVALPPAPVLAASRAPRAAAPSKSTFSAPADPSPLAVALNVGDVLDAVASSIGGDINGTVGDGQTVGDCPVGSLCGDAQLPAANLPKEIPRIGGIIKEPLLIEGRAPQYPSVAQAAGVSGQVSIEAHVGLDGRIVEAHVVQSHRLFDDAALASVRSRRYRPLLLNGVPTDFLITITVVFNIKR